MEGELSISHPAQGAGPWRSAPGENRQRGGKQRSKGQFSAKTRFSHAQGQDRLQ